ncbi:Transcription termination factor Rho, partial [Ophiophagus hannah]
MEVREGGKEGRRKGRREGRTDGRDKINGREGGKGGREGRRDGRDKINGREGGKEGRRDGINGREGGKEGKQQQSGSGEEAALGTSESKKRIQAAFLLNLIKATCELPKKKQLPAQLNQETKTNILFLSKALQNTAGPWQKRGGLHPSKLQGPERQQALRASTSQTHSNISLSSFNLMSPITHLSPKIINRARERTSSAGLSLGFSEIFPPSLNMEGVLLPLTYFQLGAQPFCFGVARGDSQNGFFSRQATWEGDANQETGHLIQHRLPELLHSQERIQESSCLIRVPTPRPR